MPLEEGISLFFLFKSFRINHFSAKQIGKMYYIYYS